MFLLKLLKFTSVLLGCIILPVSLIALFDPVGTKMADDGDPFGDPGGPLYPIFLLIVSLVLIYWPVVLGKNGNSKTQKINENTNTGDGKT